MTDFTLINIVPQVHSNEVWQDAEPSIGVNQADPSQIVISAFTPPDPNQTNGPVYYSEDGGASWHLSFIVPGGEPDDQTFKFASRSNQFYGGELASGEGDQLDVLSTSDPFTVGTMTEIDQVGFWDQPFIEVTTIPFGPNTGNDVVFVGYNAYTAGPATARVQICQNAAVANPTFTTADLEPRSNGTAGQNGPQVRVAVNTDGTVYALYAGWRSRTGIDVTTDVVVARDDNWASGTAPFTDLPDPGDQLAGYRVQTGVAIAFDALGGSPGHQNAGALGQERVAGAFTIAVDPTNSDRVVICWAGIVNSVYTLNVQLSATRGASWDAAGLTIPNATNPALAIASDGAIGLVYQQLNGTGQNQTWDTHFRDSPDGTTWSDAVLATTPANVPVLNTGQGLTYIGDYIDMVAVGRNFYGTFCANNTPAAANFPTVMATFLRNVDAATETLVGTDGVTPVAASIDPFFFAAIRLPAYQNFYVRDWTDSPTSGDTGLEPSTHADFWATSDVWNQSSSATPNPPNANDQPQSENALSGATNYAFARIRRNEAAPAGSGATVVSAHFYVSEFGTGSNFVDDTMSDPQDPDITFPTAVDPTVTFQESDVGPLDTPAFAWQLGTTTSDHLCIAVEITAPDDPPLTPSLLGRTPGPADPLVIADNHKAQRNLSVSLGARGHGNGRSYGIVHNGELGTRDVVIALSGPGYASVPEGTSIVVVSDHGVVLRQPVKQWDRITLAGMTPGENRWIGTSIPLRGDAVTVGLVELRGDRPVSGYGHVVRAAPISQVVAQALADHQKILIRLDQGFGVAAAGAALAGPPVPGVAGDDGDFEFHERVRAEAGDIKIELDVRISAPYGAASASAPGGGTPADPTGSYEAFARGQVAVLEACLGELAARDPFEIGVALSELASVPAGDLGALAAAHEAVIGGFDAFMTMLQKAGGDRADILQMVRWHAQLCARPKLAALPATAAILAALDGLIAAFAAGTFRLPDYGTVLGAITPGLAATASALGAGAALDPLLAAIGAATTARAKEHAHRGLLLALAPLT